MKQLPDSGSCVNLVSRAKVEKLRLPTQKLKEPITLGSIKENNALTLREEAKFRFRVGNRYEISDKFLVADLPEGVDMILGRPWINSRCPQALAYLQQYGEPTEVSGGGDITPTGVTALAERTQDWGQEAAENALCLLLAHAHVTEALHHKREHPEAFTGRAAVQGQDPGVRGLTKPLPEGWRDTIPKEFRRFTESVLNTERPREGYPDVPKEFECVITLREGQVLKKAKPYDMSVGDLEILKELLDQELAKDIIEPAQTPWGHPGFFVKDPGSKQKRWVVDFRDVNSKSDDDVYPLPRITALTERTSRAKYVGIGDIESAFAMLSMAEKSKIYTAFVTQHGLFQYKRMPMGIKKGPSVWQRFANWIFGEPLFKYMYLYVDDFTIMSKTREEHVRNWTKVLEICEKWKLRMKPHKCLWFETEVDFLGFTLVAGKGVTMAKDKMEAILEMERPQRPRDVKSFLGSIGFYDKLIPMYSDVASPLTDLLKKDTPWEWNELREQAFQELKKRLVRIFLHAHEAGWKTRLSTDSSDTAYGGKIEQQDPATGLWYPLIMFSHKFKEHEIGWGMPDKELYAIVFAFQRYRYFLGVDDEEIEVESDCRNLAAFMFTTDLSRSHTGRLVRWWEVLSPFRFRITHIDGDKNVVPDWLSRYNQADAADHKPLQVLPAYRFSTKSLQFISQWLKKDPDSPNIHKLLERSFASQPPKNNEAMRKILSDDKLNDSVDVATSTTDQSAATLMMDVDSFGERWRQRYPGAKVIEVGREAGDRSGLGYGI